MIFNIKLQKNITMKNVYFLPWEGPNYNAGFNGKKILVVGASHYCDEGCIDCPQKCSKDVTINTIKENARTNITTRYKKTFTCFERAMTNKESNSLTERESFWDSVSFYNFCKTPVSNCKKKPSNDSLIASVPAFKEVLTSLKPDVVIIWGTHTRDTILSQLDCELLEQCNKGNLYSLKYDSSSKAVLCPIHHPSIGFSWQEWHPFIDKAINTSI